MLTTQQVAERANIHVNTVRKYSSQYAALLSPGARGGDGARLFSEQDVEILCTIAALRRTGMHPSAIVEQLQADAAPPVIDVAPTQATQSPHAAPTDATHALAVLSIQHDTYMALQRRIEAVERNQHTLLRAATLWGVLLGAIGALAVGAFYFWVLWLLGG